MQIIFEELILQPFIVFSGIETVLDIAQLFAVAGGPLAAFRNKNPELTRYETAVKGLYLTGAATFPGAGVWGASGRNAATVVLRRP